MRHVISSEFWYTTGSLYQQDCLRKLPSYALNRQRGDL
jgi:hypothetical protein